MPWVTLPAHRARPTAQPADPATAPEYRDVVAQPVQFAAEAGPKRDSEASWWTTDPVGSPRLLVPDNAAVEVRYTVTFSARRPKPKAKPAADPQRSSFLSVERADPAPLGGLRPKPRAKF